MFPCQPASWWRPAWMVRTRIGLLGRCAIIKSCGLTRDSEMYAAVEEEGCRPAASEAASRMGLEVFGGLCGVGGGWVW